LGGRTCPGWGPDISGLGLCNPSKEEGQTSLARDPDMSGQSLWNPDRGPNMSGLIGVFDGRVDF
jgi:hypothetical protein